MPRWANKEEYEKWKADRAMGKPEEISHGSASKLNRKLSAIHWIGVVSGVLVLLVMIFSERPEKEKPSIEEMLATIDGKYDRINIARYRSLLKQLADTYVEDRQQIADMTVMAQEKLKEKGIREDLLNIMEGMNRIFSQRVDNQKYAEYVSIYIALRDDGMSHSEAIVSIDKLLENMGVY